MGKIPTHHGGPQIKTRTPDSSARKRGLKQSGETPKTKAKIIMRGGKPVMSKHLSNILSDILASRARLDAQLELSPKFRNRPQQAGRERLGSAGTQTNVNRTIPRDPGAGEQAMVDERA